MPRTNPLTGVDASNVQHVYFLRMRGGFSKHQFANITLVCFWKIHKCEAGKRRWLEEELELILYRLGKHYREQMESLEEFRNQLKGSNHDD